MSKDIKIKNNTDFPYQDILSKIDMKKDEYINQLLDSKDIYNHNCFNGLLSYIGTLFSNNKYNTEYVSIDYSDFSLLDILFHYFVNLCSIYKQTVFIQGFQIFLSVPHSTFARWINGTHKLTPAELDTIFSWRLQAETSLLSSDTVKSTFLLQTTYGYTENSEKQAVQDTQVSQLPPADGLLLPEQN